MEQTWQCWSWSSRSWSWCMKKIWKKNFSLAALPALLKLLKKVKFANIEKESLSVTFYSYLQLSGIICDSLNGLGSRGHILTFWVHGIVTLQNGWNFGNHPDGRFPKNHPFWYLITSLLVHLTKINQDDLFRFSQLLAEAEENWQTGKVPQVNSHPSSWSPNWI